MPKNAREKELARAAAKREEDKRRARRRQNVLRSGLVIVAFVAVAVLGYLLLPGKSTNTAANSPSPLAPAQLSPSPIKDFPCFQDQPAVTPAKFTSATPPPMTIDKNATYIVSMNTSCGAMKIKLLPKQAPLAVNNFVYLVKKHWYNGLVFHRVADSIDIIQTGDPKCTPPAGADCGTGGPGYTFKDELTGKEQYTPGVVAMANSGPNTNGSQIFIVTGPKASVLQPNYTIFGKLIGKQSMQTAQTIQSVPIKPGTEQPKAPVWIRGVKVREST